MRFSKVLTLIIGISFLTIACGSSGGGGNGNGGGFTLEELAGKTYQFTDSNYSDCVFIIIFNNNNQLITPNGKTFNYTIVNGSIVWTDQYGATTISVLDRNGSVSTVSISVSGGPFEDETDQWGTDFSSLNNSAVELKDWFIANGFRPGSAITADGRVTNQAASFDGRWWIDGNVFYFDNPGADGCVDNKAYKLENDRLMFATDAGHVDELTMVEI
jgi:hypothetical protein